MQKSECEKKFYRFLLHSIQAYLKKDLSRQEFCMDDLI